MFQKPVTWVRGVYLFFCACLQMVAQKNTKTALLHKLARALVHALQSHNPNLLCINV